MWPLSHSRPCPPLSNSCLDCIFLLERLVWPRTVATVCSSTAWQLPGLTANTPLQCCSKHPAAWPAETPQWRDGPYGLKTACNACGIKYKRGNLPGFAVSPLSGLSMLAWHVFLDALHSLPELRLQLCCQGGLPPSYAALAKLSCMAGWHPMHLPGLLSPYVCAWAWAAVTLCMGTGCCQSMHGHRLLSLYAWAGPAVTSN